MSHKNTKIIYTLNKTMVWVRHMKKKRREDLSKFLDTPNITRSNQEKILDELKNNPDVPSYITQQKLLSILETNPNFVFEMIERNKSIIPRLMTDDNKNPLSVLESQHINQEWLRSPIQKNKWNAYANKYIKGYLESQIIEENKTKENYNYKMLKFLESPAEKKLLNSKIEKTERLIEEAKANNKKLGQLEDQLVLLKSQENNQKIQVAVMLKMDRENLEKSQNKSYSPSTSIIRQSLNIQEIARKKNYDDMSRIEKDLQEEDKSPYAARIEINETPEPLSEEEKERLESARNFSEPDFTKYDEIKKTEKPSNSKDDEIPSPPSFEP